MVELLLDHGARVNFNDQSMLTALHIAVTGQHRHVMSMLLKHGAHLKAKAEHGDTDTPLMRAVLANSREMTQELLEHEAHVDKLPALLRVASLRGPTDPVDERGERATWAPGAGLPRTLQAFIAICRPGHEMAGPFPPLSPCSQIDVKQAKKMSCGIDISSICTEYMR